MISRIENEITQLHRFFVDWYLGNSPVHKEQFVRFTSVLAEGFTLITPKGISLDRQTIIETIRKSYNSREDFRIWIENIGIRLQVNDMVLATYEEWQEDQEEITSRISSVLFRERSGTPNGLIWLHVHETWINKTSQNI